MNLIVNKKNRMIDLNSIGAIFFDLDRTTLDSRKEMPFENLEIIEKLISLNKNIVIATARPYRATQKYFSKTTLEKISLILLNGAEIYFKNKKVKQFIITKKEIENIYTELTNEFTKITFGYEYNGLCQTNAHFTRHWHKSMENKVDFDDYKIEASSKILIDISSLDLKTFITENYSKDLKITITDGDTLCQIMPKQTSKSKALKYLEKHHINYSKRICFGDDVNDIDLFEFCDYPIAMKNAIPEIKQLAYFETLSNDNNGIHHFFKTMINV